MASSSIEQKTVQLWDVPPGTLTLFCDGMDLSVQLRAVDGKIHQVAITTIGGGFPDATMITNFYQDRDVKPLVRFFNRLEPIFTNSNGIYSVNFKSFPHVPDGAFGPLPDNITEILASSCLFLRGKTVRETHQLVYIPRTVNGEPLTLNKLPLSGSTFFVIKAQ